MSATEGQTIERLDLSQEWEFDIACDISGLRLLDGYPKCQGDPARWVAWRPNCCAQGPRYRLICDFCKRTYQNWTAKMACVRCGHCGAETGGFCAFTPLQGKS